MALLLNYPLIAAFAAILLAQGIKIPINMIKNQSLEWRLAVSTGGMPSSHSAAVASLSTGIGIEEGMGSTLFAVSVIFSVIIMFDAAGVRRHAGEQAMYLNRLIEEFDEVFREMVSLKKMSSKNKKVLKELLGHRPVEVFVGALFGIGLSLAIYFIFYY
ncbi:divergent PAP2 family protein [Pullulanibacillus sp. KACC 23026]|uniref:divergent PAP2 family protein n=1 Tax=Pullulanibacillus sp. KACC 23026 TaxID=3028315 RepID=UPI0023B03E7D|nr:divergent PAP2 family protein [Pullulanibacillus sp. KACC 23026]WEG11313.1 divergent PAP2 family protein [Pullulanibacillus sp. KACC 23026]